jgi:effector-binding domain-containing protein
LDIAIETDRVPAQLGGRIQSRIQPGGEVLIAHMWGPYGQAGQAYGQIENWLKENKRKPKGSPFEVYVNDPNIAKNPSEIQTDICQPIE